ncbi:MAG: EAL domain-containing protein [Lachnospiraceae bacterium]|nr:EAL domain-containing protein [Lachnospiraceae bacterium]
MLLEDVLNVKRLILVADDQEINREILGMILEDSFTIIYAENGVEALRLARENRKVLSAILLDLIMPEMDGYEVIKTLKQDSELSHIPIIVLTAEASAELETLRLGAATFITKPFDNDEIILARVARIVELSETQRILRATERDELTGLYSERFFFEYAEQYRLYRPEQDKDVMAIDICRFRVLNEMYGRTFGDLVLSTLGKTIAMNLRKYGGIGGRIDSNTIFIFMPHQNNHELIIDSLTRTLNALKPGLNIRLRMGVCTMGDHVLNLQHRFSRAKDACNMLRNNYRKSVQIYDEEMHQQEVLKQALLNDLPKALEEEQFIVYYQPKFDITGSHPFLRSAEALIRWKHPVYGMISPGVFIPLFESNGLIHKVDYFVWKKTAQQIRIWRDRYGITLPISVNLSRVNIHEENLENKLMELVRENDLSPQDLHLEVTESAYTDDASRLVEVIVRLRELGFAIEMDDFGSGYSSLNMLSLLPIDVLKMDMQFVRNLKDEDSSAHKMVQIILDIAKYLNVPVIAEGAENEIQVRILKNAGCHMIQGYYFSRPVPPEEFEKFIEERKESEAAS